MFINGPMTFGIKLVLQLYFSVDFWHGLQSITCIEVQVMDWFEWMTACFLP